jgi:hypothetical protein
MQQREPVLKLSPDPRAQVLERRCPEAGHLVEEAMV